MGRQRVFHSSDGKYKVLLTAASVHSLVARCSEASDTETGGILLGHYNAAHDTAIVSYVSEAPTDSECGTTWFTRGVRGLQRLISKFWREREYYLGEWHFHPNGSATPSGQDIAQMAEIANTPSYHCPEPLLLVVGGKCEEYSFGAYVCLASGHRQRLNEMES